MNFQSHVKDKLIVDAERGFEGATELTRKVDPVEETVTFPIIQDRARALQPLRSSAFVRTWTAP